MSGNNRYKSPIHTLWWPRIAGQIRDCIKSHPELFSADHAIIINSLSKRIVGEIAADVLLADNKRNCGCDCGCVSKSFLREILRRIKAAWLLSEPPIQNLSRLNHALAANEVGAVNHAEIPA